MKSAKLSCMRKPCQSAVALRPAPAVSPVRRMVVLRRADPKEGAGGGMINEDVLARLQRAEEEAAKLRQELAAARGADKPVASAEAVVGKKARVDSESKRETLFTDGSNKRTAWLSEADVEFFTGKGLGETAAVETVKLDPEAEKTIQKRLVLGGIASLVIGALSLVPDSSLQLKPSKPMYFYVVPLLRVRDALGDLGPVIEDADWAQLRLVLGRMTGVPNNVRANMDSITALLEDSKTVDKARTVTTEFIEYLDAMDYQKYYDAIPTRNGVIPGDQNLKFVAFSSKALKAAISKLDAYLSLVPASALADARAQMGS